MTINTATNFYPGIDTALDLIGKAGEFTLSIQLATDGATVVNDGDGLFTEDVSDYIATTGETSKDIAVGDTELKVAPGSTLVYADVILFAGEYNYITNVVGQYVTLKNKVLSVVPAGTVINSVGNTGIYRAECNIAVAGSYVVSIQHPSSRAYVQSVTISDNDATVDLTVVTDAIDALNDFDPLLDAVANVTLVGTTEVNLDMVAPDQMTTNELHAGLDSYANKADWKESANLVVLEDKIDAIRTVVDLIKVDTTVLDENDVNSIYAKLIEVEADIQRAIDVGSYESL